MRVEKSLRVTFNLNPSVKSQGKGSQPVEWSPTKKDREPDKLTQVRVMQPVKATKRFAIKATDLQPKNLADAEPRPKSIPEITDLDVKNSPGQTPAEPGSIPETQAQAEPKSIPEIVSAGQNELSPELEEKTSALVIQTQSLPATITEDQNNRGILQALSELLGRVRFLLDRFTSGQRRRVD